MLRGLFARGLAMAICDWKAGKPDTEEKRGVIGDTWSEDELLDLDGPEPQLFCGGQWAWKQGWVWCDLHWRLPLQVLALLGLRDRLLLLQHMLLHGL
nr:hypothetical protein BaRGS_007918 [Batillaria attramentaria]